MRRVQLNLMIAWRSLCNFRLRTLLAILGVFLGAFSLIVVSNISGSLSRKTDLEIASLGENLLIVRSGTVRRLGAGTALLSQATNLTPGDAAAIAQSSGFIGAVSPSGNRSFPVRYGNTTLPSVLVVGVVPNYQDVRNFRVKEGRFIADEDDKSFAKVAVIGSRIAEKLFGRENPIGRHILIYRVPCLVVGVMEEKGVDLSGLDQDSQIFVPLATYLRRLVNKDFLGSIYLRVSEERLLPAAKGNVEEILRQRHRIRKGQADDFTVISMKDVLALKTQATETITVLGRIAALVSFLIGGLGILSIMILIVNERRVEIGIRRAVGSRKRDIVLQFLMESSVISLTGGMVGVFFGILASVIIALASRLPLSLSVAGLGAAFIASVVIGMLAGIYPSKKATMIQPVDIIRS